MRKLTLAICSLLLPLALPCVALAKGGTPQNHHCMKDGTELTGKTRKECGKEGGKWEKMPGAAGKGAGDKGSVEPAPKADPK